MIVEIIEICYIYFFEQFDITSFVSKMGCCQSKTEVLSNTSRASSSSSLLIDHSLAGQIPATAKNLSDVSKSSSEQDISRNSSDTNTVPTDSTFCDSACASSSTNNLGRYSQLECNSYQPMVNVNIKCDSRSTAGEGSPKVQEISPQRNLIFLTSSPGKTIISEVKEHDLQKTLQEEDLSFLAPTCVISQKEIVSLDNDNRGQRKDNTQIDNLLYVIIAYKFYENLPNQLQINDVCKQVSGFTNPMKSALNRIPGDSMSARIQVFVSVFDKVFVIHGYWISRKCDGEDWLETSLLELLKSALIVFIEEGKNSVSELSEMLLLTLGKVDIPLFGSVCDNNVKLFLSRYKTIFGTAKDSVFLVLGIEKSFGPSIDQSSLKEVTNFFKNILKANAIPYTELPFVLSMKNPELLAVLIDRTCEGILALLLKDKAFKCVDGLVMLEGFTPVNQCAQLKETNESDKSFHEGDTCVCSSGIVMSVGKSRATLWCSQSEICKNVFVVAKRTATLVNGATVCQFPDVLQEGDRVVFITNQTSSDEWIVDSATHIKTVAEQEFHSICLCKKRRKIDVFYQQVAQANGFSNFDSLILFWKCRGIVKCLKGNSGIVQCMFNSSCAQYFRVRVIDSTWVIGLNRNLHTLEQFLTVGDDVEVDISLRNSSNAGMLNWYAICLRKFPFVPFTPSSSVLWNCAGKVFNIGPNGFTIEVEKGSACNEQETFFFAPSESVFILEDGSCTPVALAQDSLRINDKVRFDAEKSFGETWTAKIIRQCKTSRELLFMNPVLENTVTAVAALEEVLKESVPVLMTLSKKNKESSLTYKEIMEMANSYRNFESVTRTLEIDSLSHSSDPYDFKQKKGSFKSVRNTICQTTSTGTVCSTWFPN